MSPPSKKQLLARKKAANAAGALWTKPGAGRSAQQKRATKEKVAATVGAVGAALHLQRTCSTLRTICYRHSLAGEAVEGAGRRGCLALLSLADYAPSYLRDQRLLYKYEVWVEPPLCGEMRVWCAPKSAQDDPLGRMLFAHEYTPRGSRSKRKLAPPFVCCMCACEGARHMERLPSCCATCARPMECAMLAQRQFWRDKEDEAFSPGRPLLEAPADICGVLAIWLSFRRNAAKGPGCWRLPELSQREAGQWVPCHWCDRLHGTANKACTECEDLHKWARLALADDVRAMLVRWEGGKTRLVPGSRNLLAHFTGRRR